MARVITELPAELATIRRGLPHSIPLVYTDDQGRFLPLSGQAFTVELRASKALDSPLLGTYTVSMVAADYGKLKATLATTSGLIAGDGWVTARVNGTSTGGVDTLILDAPARIV